MSEQEQAPSGVREAGTDDTGPNASGQGGGRREAGTDDTNAGTTGSARPARTGVIGGQDVGVEGDEGGPQDH